MNGHELGRLLASHEYRFGYDTNCACGAPSIWFWEDYCKHIAEIVGSAK